MSARAKAREASAGQADADEYARWVEFCRSRGGAPASTLQGFVGDGRFGHVLGWAHGGSTCDAATRMPTGLFGFVITDQLLREVAEHAGDPCPICTDFSREEWKP